ncbi:MAG: dTDP-4-dehydrorhamnose reductase [Proteobacteria bacterium]|nr:dTDP-4-dehydrorhamnose reductase [Pseudomonadota bacterium]NDC24353.1 dTDP-4-dehydrorhamnose reductase [Pseudomonadota bacterium]NDD04340.1 dTDP-4-dehydrorhamnose reductase [Pseudomonadota bacterium]NDG26827.1 dTDP-4-dehydrorhamnose reductase [Pseudomonadota bacterium]
MPGLTPRISGPILITGAKGMLGTELSTHFSAQDLVCTDSDRLDITNKREVAQLIQKIRPRWVINAAAYTNVDKAEIEREQAYAINTLGPKNLSEVCEDLGSSLIHFSTEYVFNGKSERPWTEEDLPEPLTPNFYAETKLLGDRAVLESKQNLVVRVQWLYGAKRERFSGLKKLKEFTPLSDQFGAPTWVRDVAQIVSQLMSKDAAGLFHFAYDDHASWLEVYEFVKKEWDLPVRLIPKRSEELNLPAKRPLYGVMSNKKLKAFLGVEKIGSWKDSLRQFLGLVSRA